MGEIKDVKTVERVIHAPASAIFDLLADPSRHCEIDGSGTVRASTERSQRLAMGSTFGMKMKLVIPYTMRSTIIEFETDRLIAWQTWGSFAIFNKVAGGRIWRYELAPVEGGTMVRESWDIRKERAPALVRPAAARTVKAMAATLERIASIVESK